MCCLKYEVLPPVLAHRIEVTSHTDITIITHDEHVGIGTSGGLQDLRVKGSKGVRINRTDRTDRINTIGLMVWGQGLGSGFGVRVFFIRGLGSG